MYQAFNFRKIKNLWFQPGSVKFILFCKYSCIHVPLTEFTLLFTDIPSFTQVTSKVFFLSTNIVIILNHFLLLFPTSNESKNRGFSIVVDMRGSAWQPLKTVTKVLQVRRKKKKSFNLFSNLINLTTVLWFPKSGRLWTDHHYFHRYLHNDEFNSRFPVGISK